MDVNQQAPVRADAERSIAAPADLVWSVLTDLDGWVRWNPDVTRMEWSGGLEPGAEFRWKAGGMSIVSRIREVVPSRRIVWTGRTMGIRAVHVWIIEPKEDGVLVRTEESFEGLVATLLAVPLRRMLPRSLAAGLDALADECEGRLSAAEGEPAPEET